MSFPASLGPTLSLKQFVPKDKFYRRLETMLDLTFVRDLVRDLYATLGLPSVGPMVFLELRSASVSQKASTEGRTLPQIHQEFINLCFPF
jgi:hypothetical protein